MPTQPRPFSAQQFREFSQLEKEVNDWLAAKGRHYPTRERSDRDLRHRKRAGPRTSQAVIVALWYLDPPGTGIKSHPTETSEITPSFALEASRTRQQRTPVAVFLSG